MFCPPLQAGRTKQTRFDVHTPLFLATLVLVACFSPLSAGEPTTSSKMPACDNPVQLSASNAFFIGHSLVNFDMPHMFEQLAADAGLSADAGTQVNNGAPIRFNWQNRFRASFPGEWPPPNFAGDDLPSGRWDALIMTEGIPLETNVTWNESSLYAGRFVDLARQHNSGTRSFIYETWHSLNEANWLNRIVTDLPLWESIMDDVNESRGAGVMNLIPAGQALRNLIIQIEGGQIPGYNSRNQLFVDDIHMNDMGNYFIACVMYATIYRRSPVGLEYRMNDIWGSPYNAPSAALAAAMQQTAWDTVRNYEHNGFVCQGGGNERPNGTIDSPSANQTITAGDSVTFAGSASDPDNNTPFTYLWNFAGGASNSTSQDPGSVQFNTPGTYDVTFTVTDSLGLADATPATVRITVQAPANQAPNGTISRPSANTTITAGDRVTFTASASDPDNNTPFTYFWNFDGGATNSTNRDPGSVQFNNPGSYDVTFTVTDSLGLADPSPDTVRITVQAPANQAPNSIIDTPSSNRTITAGETVSFNGSASDPDNNTPFTYFWNFDGGATNSTSQDPGNVRFNTPGTYDVTFTVTDSLGLADPSPDTVRITVQAPANQAPNGTIDSPVANITITEGETVNFAGSASDPDNNTPFTYLWNFGGGATNSTSQDPGSVRFDTPGSYTVSFTVTDSLGLADPTPATVRVTVQEAANQAPNGTIDSPGGNTTITEGQTVNFSGSASDPDNDTPLTYLWNFGGGATNSTRQDPGAIRFDNPGTFTVTFTVTDSQGLADPTPDTVRVTVQEAANQAPNGTIDSPGGNTTITEGQTVNFSGSASDPDNDTPLTYLWNFGGGATNSTSQDPGAVRFDNPGTFTVTFTVTDSEGLADPTPDTVRVTVQEATNQAPNGTIDTPTGNITITEGESVNFTASASDPDGDTPLTYLWDFDGAITNSTLQDIGLVPFNNAGVYTVTFTVTDSEGLADPTPDSVVVTVEAPNRAPNGRIDSPGSGAVIQVGETLNFLASATDPDGDTDFRYLWDFDGVITNSTLQDPGVVPFSRPGTFTITFRVWDSEGLEDPTPAVTTVQVTQNNRAPEGTIDSPSSNLTIATGQSIFFSGTATDPDDDRMTYLWNFDGVVAGSTLEDPGSIPFNRPGTFTITFTVTDEHGISDPTPARVIVTVNDGGNGTPAQIASPAKSLSVLQGTSLLFSGLVGDLPNPTYLWDFDGAVTNSTLQNPGMIPFNNPGMYVITFTVTSQGVSYPSRPISVEVVTCEQPRIEAATLVQGLAPVELEAISCEGANYSIQWQNITNGGIIARDTTLLTLDPRFTETTVVRLALRHNNTGRTYSHDVTVLVPDNAELVDFNGNGCNDVADLRAYATYWNDRDAAMDANGDGIIDVRDLLHINTREEGACP